MKDSQLNRRFSRLNRRALGESYLKASSTSNGLPVYLVIESTSICNLKCVMCPYPIMGRENEHIEISLYERIIEEASGHVEFIWLQLFGEPLLNPNIYKMIDFAEEAGIRVGVSTNATRLTEKASRALLESRLSVLLVCMDGATKQTYEAIRVGASFEKVKQNVRRFAELKKEIPSRLKATMQMVEMELNSNEKSQFQLEWKDAGFDNVLIKPFAVWANQSPELVQFGAQQRPGVEGVCSEPWVGMTVQADGTVVPCCNDYSGRNPLGDLKTQTLREVWNGSEMRKLRSMLADPYSDRTGTICHLCPFPVANPMDAKHGRGAFDPITTAMNLYLESENCTPPLDQAAAAMISVQLGNQCRQSMEPGEEVEYKVIVTNGSSFTLSSNGATPVNLSYHWRRQIDNEIVLNDGVRSPLRPDLMAADEHVYPLKVVAPAEAGDYRLHICLVQEGVMWLDDERSSGLMDVAVTSELSSAEYVAAGMELPEEAK